MPRSSAPIIQCSLLPETKERIARFAEALEAEAPNIGDHGLTDQEFRDSGLFASAVERLRGQKAASMRQKQSFMRDVFEYLRDTALVSTWVFTGSGERHDYEISMPSHRVSIVETKGCLDGNNTNIFERPPQADEFVIWSLCQNPGADPRHNAWSGIHTRLSAEVIHRSHNVDGVVIWDMLCGTAGRPCPKLAHAPDRATVIGASRDVPPPCIYLFPRSIPDPRNNPSPPCWELNETELLNALYRAFKGDASDVTQVKIEARMNGPHVQRRTRFYRRGEEFRTSRWTTLRRARR